MIKGNLARRLGLVLLALVAASCATAPADAGRKGTGLGFRHSVQSFTPVIAASVTYDTAIGASVDTNGIASLPLRVGAHRYFVNSSTGTDSNNCTAAQSAATPKATLGGAFTCVTDNAGAGDQILLAEGSTYTEDWGNGTATYPTPNGGQWLAYKGGFSATYPTVIQSYDPADPTNTTKYGQGVYRGNPPVFTGVQTNFSNCPSTYSYIAIRGIKFDNQSTTVNHFFGFVGHAGYLLIEGDYFKNTQLSADGCDAYTGNSAPTSPTTFILRNNVFDTPWDVTIASGGNGRVGALYINDYNGITWEDNFIYHNGWGPSQTRATLDPAQAQTHPIYTMPWTTNVIGRRNLIIDPSYDGGMIRGDGRSTENVVIGSPAGIGMGPPSTETLQRTDGLDLRADHNLVLAGIDYGPGVDPKGKGFDIDLGKPGSSIDHNLIIRKDAATADRQTQAFANFAWATNSYRSYAEFHHNISFDWNDSGYSYLTTGGPAPTYALPYTSYDYNLWDDPTGGTNTHATAGLFTNPYTESALYLAAGYANKAALIAAMRTNPLLHVQRIIRALAFAGFGQELDDAHRLDQTAPVISSATASSPSAGNATIGATTDEGNGKLYYELLTTATQPAKAQVKMGVDASHAAGTSPGALTIASSGVKSVNLSGVPPGTYYAHLVHEDAAGNKSNIVTSSSFTVAALSAIWNGSTDTPASGAVWTRSNGNLTATRTTNDDTIAQLFASQAKASGTVIVTVTAKGTGNPSLFGGAYSALPISIGIDPGNETSVVGSSHGIGYRNDGTVLFEGSTLATGLATLNTGDALKIVKDATNLKFYVNNVLQYTFTGSDYNFSDVHGAAYPAATSIGSHDTALTIDASGW